jgi:hypothetical protein
MMHHIIYKTTCLITNKWYLGMHSTENLADGYLGSGVHLKRSISKYGKEQHVREILEHYPDRQSLHKREIALVNSTILMDPLCLNLKIGGQGLTSSEAIQNWENPEYCAKQKESRLKSWNNPTIRNKRCKANKEGWRNRDKVKFAEKISECWKDSTYKDKVSKGVSEAWARRKEAGFKKCWVIKDAKAVSIDLESLNTYLQAGYKRGRK